MSFQGKQKVLLGTGVFFILCAIYGKDTEIVEFLMLKVANDA